MKLLKEFKEFAARGNVVDLAIGVVIGTAFGKIVTSLVEDIIMPPIGMLLGKVNFADLVITLQEGKFDEVERNKFNPAVTINYGNFLQILINFIIIAFVIFMVVKVMNRFKREEPKKDKKEPEEVKLLREIRDALKKK